MNQITVCLHGYLPEHCPECRKLTNAQAPELVKTWKNPKYLAGLIDGEGSFHATPEYEPKAKRWYLIHGFTIRMLATKEWREIAEHLKSLYGGSTWLHNGERYLGYGIRKEESLLSFLVNLVPIMHLKRRDAKNLLASLEAYTWIPHGERGRARRQDWDEWLRRYFLR